MEATLEINDEREELNQIYQLYLHFCRDGGAAIYSVYDPSLHDAALTSREVPDEELGARKVDCLKEIPLRVQVIDPESIIALPGGPKRWLGLGRAERRSVLDIESLYSVRIADFVDRTQTEKSDIMGDFVDWWDFVYKEVPKMIDGEEVKNEVLGKTETEKKLLVRNTVLYMGKPSIARGGVGARARAPRRQHRLGTWLDESRRSSLPRRPDRRIRALLVSRGVDCTEIVNQADVETRPGVDRVTAQQDERTWLRSFYFFDPDGIMLEFCATVNQGSPDVELPVNAEGIKSNGRRVGE